MNDGTCTTFAVRFVRPPFFRPIATGVRAASSSPAPGSFGLASAASVAPVAPVVGTTSELTPVAAEGGFVAPVSGAGFSPEPQPQSGIARTARATQIADFLVSRMLIAGLTNADI